MSEPGTAFSAEPSALLSLRGVSVRFGGIVALDDVSFEVPRGSVCGLIGPNGAGKTTCFNCLSGLYRPSSGAIRFEQHDLLALPKYRIAELGVGRTFQNLALFPSMSVRRNILVGGHSRGRSGFFAHALRLSAVAHEEHALEHVTERLIDELDLRSVADREVDSLPFGTKKRVEFARALASQPKLLILDEPAAGLNHEEIIQLRDLIKSIPQKHCATVLLVEHHMDLVMSVTDKIVVLDFGKKIADGLPAEIQRHPDVIRAYLGADA